MGLLSRTQSTKTNTPAVAALTNLGLGTGVGSTSGSTPMFNKGPSTTDILKSIGQGTARGYGAVGAGIANVISGGVVPPEFTPIGKLQQDIFGTKESFSLQTEGEGYPFVKKGSSFAPVVAGIGGILDLVGGKGIKGLSGLSKELRVVNEVSKVEDLLRGAGFADDIVISYAPKFAKLNDLKEIEKGLLSAEKLQNSTKGVSQVTKVADKKPTAGLLNRTTSKAGEVVGGVEETGKKIDPFARRERGFVSSVKEARPELEGRIAGQYVPRSTDNLAVRARNQIKDDVNLAEYMARTGTDDKSVAIASELIKKYTDDAEAITDITTKNALYDKAAELTNQVAIRLTEGGRTVQAAAIMGRMTPEGQLRFAARTIQKYNEEISKSRGGIFGIKKAIPELTGAQTEEILGKMKDIKGMPDGIQKAMAFKELQDHITSLVPTPLYKKLIAVWKAGLLTGIKTTGLNTFSNLFHGISEVAKDVPAVVVDKVASLFTGERTLALTGRGGKGITEGFKKGWDYLKTGFDERNIADKLDFKKISFGKGKFARAIQTYEESIFRVMGAEDQPFYYGAKARSLASQAIAQAKNKGLKGVEARKYAQSLVESPTDEMLKHATIDAETAVFQNSTILGNVARKIQQIPGGEVVVPFSKTPAAVATQLINYSPVGIVKTIVENIGKGKFDQRLFSQGIGRAALGTGVMYIGKELYEKGLLSLGFPKTESGQKQMELEGRKINSIKINGVWRSANTLGPLGTGLIVGGYFAQGLEKTGSLIGALTQAAAGAGKALTDQTFLRGVDQLMSAISDPVNSSGQYFSGLIGSIIPTIVSDVARSTDKYERKNQGFLDSAKSRLPGVREKLQPQVSTFGDKIETPGFFTVMLDPTRPGKDSDNPLVLELKRLEKEGYGATPTQLGDKKGFPGLTPEQNTNLWVRSGNIAKGKLESLINHPQYLKEDDAGKEKLINAITDRAKLVARTEFVVDQTKDLSGEALKNELARLKKTGLMTKEVFNLYVDLR